MAKPCNYQLAGEDTWMSESDFKKRLNDGLLDRLLAENNIKIPGIKPLKESAPRAVEQTAPSSSVVAQEREATAVDARNSIPKQFNEGYVEVDGKEKGKVYKGYSVKVNEGNKTADVKLPNGKELKNQPILQIEGTGGNPDTLSVLADGGTRIKIPSQSELDAKAEKQRMIDEEKKAPEEKKEVRRKNIKNFEELESKDALKIAEMLKFSPNEFDGTEAINKEELGLFGFDEKITVNGRSYGTDKNKATSRIIEKLVDAKIISVREGDILLEAFEAKKDAFWKAKNKAAKEGMNKKIDDMAARLKKPSGAKSTLNPFDFLPTSLRNKAIDLFADLLKKGANAGIDIKSAFQQAFYDTVISAIQSGQITEQEGNRLEAEMLKQDMSEVNIYAEVEKEMPELRTQAKYRSEEQQRKTSRELIGEDMPKTFAEIELVARALIDRGIINPKELLDSVASGERNLFYTPFSIIEQKAFELYGQDLGKEIRQLTTDILRARSEGKSDGVFADKKAKLEADAANYGVVNAMQSRVMGTGLGSRRETGTIGMTYDEMIASAKEKAANTDGELSEEIENLFKNIAAKYAEVDSKLQEKEAELVLESEKEAVQNIIDDIDEKGVDVEQDTKTVKEKAKKIAENLRRNKIHRPGMFSVASPGSIAFDIAIEAAATAIEASGSVITAVNKALSAMKNTEWYKGLSNEEKNRADSELKNYVRGYSSDMISSSDGGLKVPISLVRNLVASGVNTIEGLVEAVTKELEMTNPEMRFTERQVRDAITGYGQFIKQPKSEISKKIADLKSIGRMISTLEDLMAGIRKEKNPSKRKELTAKERFLRSQIRGLLDTIPVNPEEEIIINDNRLIDKKNRLRAKKDELIKIKQSGVRPGGRRRAQAVSDAVTDRLQAEIAALQEEIDQFPYTQEQLQEIEDKRLQQYKERTRKTIKELERKLREKDFSKKTPKSLELDQEATELRRERQALRDQVDAEIEKIELANRNIGLKVIDALVSAVNDLKSLSLSADMSAFRQAAFMMADLIFSDPKSVILFSKRVITLSGLVPKANPVTSPVKFVKELVASLKDGDNGKKLYEALQAARKQSGDYELAKKSKLFLQEDTAKIQNRQEGFAGGFVKKIPILGEPITIMGKKIPGLDIMGRGERSFSALNELRMTVFMQGVRRLREAGISYEDNPKAYEQWARHVNTLSGRGAGYLSGKAFDAVAPYVNVPFVSARFLKSRFDLSLLNPYAWVKILPGLFLPKQLSALAFRQMIAGNAYVAGLTYIGYLVVGATLAALGDDEEEEGGKVFTGETTTTEKEDENAWKLTTDIRSSDFMKLTKGDVSLDFLAGLSQTNVYLARMYSGEKRMKDGELVELNTQFNGPTYANVSGNFLMSKMVPWAQTVVRWAMDTKKEEEEMTQSDIEKEEKSKVKTEDYFLPLSVKLARDLHKQKNVSAKEEIVLNLLSFFGVGNVNVSSFGKKEESSGGVFTGTTSGGGKVFTGY